MIVFFFLCTPYYAWKKKESCSNFSHERDRGAKFVRNVADIRSIFPFMQPIPGGRSIISQNPENEFFHHSRACMIKWKIERVSCILTKNLLGTLDLYKKNLFCIECIHTKYSLFQSFSIAFSLSRRKRGLKLPPTKNGGSTPPSGASSSGGGSSLGDTYSLSINGKPKPKQLRPISYEDKFDWQRHSRKNERMLRKNLYLNNMIWSNLMQSSVAAENIKL